MKLLHLLSKIFLLVAVIYLWCWDHAFLPLSKRKAFKKGWLKKGTHLSSSSLLFIFLLTISSFLGGCSYVLYAPNGQNVPIFTEKKEARLAVSGIGGSQSEGFEIQTAYAISPKIAIMVNTLFLKTYDPNLVDADGFAVRNGKINMGEFGAGYFKPTNNGKMVFEVYGGLGFGHAENRDSIYGLSSVNFLRLFAQPSIGRKGKHVEFAFSSRVGILNYSEWEHEFNTGKPWVLDKTRTQLLLEPAFTIRAGWENIKFQSQVILSMNATQIYNVEEYPQEFFCINVGVYIALRPKKNETKNNVGSL